MPTPILTADHTWLRLRQDEYFQPFFRQYLEILKSRLKQIQVMDHNGNLHRSYYTCGEHHDRQNPNWKPFKLFDQHCVDSGYDFLKARDVVQERIGRKLICECEILK
jgi:hypothetical protein